MPTGQLDQRIPVVTIGGFLGAGKTTLLNHVLSQADGRRIVVFVNDFGAINLDVELVDTTEANRISLKNGCVCCTLNDDLIGNIKSFLDETEQPFAFVIEASGVADPRSLDNSIQMLETAGSVRLDNRIYVVDTDQFLDQDFENTEQIVDHAAAADLIILNKTDIADAALIKNAKNTFARSAPHSSLISAINCALPIEVIIGQPDQVARHETKLQPTFGKGLSEPVHGFSSWSRQTHTPLDRDKFHRFMTKLPKMCFRAKGRLDFGKEHTSASVFHLVGKRASLETAKTVSNKSGSLIVAIGKSSTLDPEQLDEWFDAVLQ